MRRAHIAWLSVLSAFLVSQGAGPSGVAPRQSPGSEQSPGQLNETQVSEYLEHLNPDLSEGQNARIAAAVVKYSAKYGLDTTLVLAVIHQESTARPWARSEKGAVGLMQVMPHMRGSVNVAGNLTSIETNIEAGCIILADNIRRLGEERGILAYFWGNDIRGDAYLVGIQAARAAIRRRVAES